MIIQYSFSGINKLCSFVLSRCNIRFVITLCIVVVIVETLVLLDFAGYQSFRVRTVYPNLVLERGWTKDLQIPSCQQAESIIKEQQYIHCYLFLAVMVRPNGFDRRDLIRKTWYCDFTTKHSLTRIRFFVGTQNLSQGLLEMLHREQALHHDIVMLDELVDSYENLTSKVVQTMKWTTEHANFTYYLKCDDDSYPLLNPIISELQRRGRTDRLYWGHFFVDLHVPTRGKNFDKGWFLTKRYTPFAIGGAYILSGDLVHLIVGLEKCLQLYQNEDISVGLWLAPYHIERKHDYRFCRSSHTCLHDTIMFLGRSKEQLLSLFKSML